MAGNDTSVQDIDEDAENKHKGISLGESNIKDIEVQDNDSPSSKKRYSRLK